MFLSIPVDINTNMNWFGLCMYLENQVFLINRNNSIDSSILPLFIQGTLEHGFSSYWQFGPVNPFKHWHWYLFTSSMHVPALRHGFDVHSSMLKWHSVPVQPGSHIQVRTDGVSAWQSPFIHGFFMHGFNSISQWSPVKTNRKSNCKILEEQKFCIIWLITDL